jgi:hypothetical protein
VHYFGAQASAATRRREPRAAARKPRPPRQSDSLIGERALGF